MSNKNNKRRPPSVKAKIDKLYDNPDSVIRASASVTVAGAVSIHGLRVMDSSKGLFVGMPTRSYEDKNGKTKYVDMAHPITAEAREAISDSVLKASNYLNGQFLEHLLDYISEYSDGVVIPDKDFESKNLNILSWQSRLVLYVVVIAIPLLILLAGILIWSKRRHL